MSFTNITSPSVGDPTKKQSFAQAVIDNLVYIFNTLLGLKSFDTFPNGSFEVDTDNDGIPDGWTETSNGGLFALDTNSANIAHGTKSLKITSTGAGGGYVQTTDFFEVTPARNLTFSWQMKSSVAGLTNKVEVLWYDSAQSFLSSTTLYTNSTTNATSFTLYNVMAVPPANARFAKLKITGADSATSGSVYYDDFQIIPNKSACPNGSQQFTASGSFTVPTYVNRVKVRVWGGGGGGVPNSANGGCGGGYAEGIVAVTPGQVITVTIGAGGAANGTGGTSSFGGSVTASGGTPGGIGGAGGIGGGASMTVSIRGENGTGGAGGSPGGGSGGPDRTAGIAPGGGGGGDPIGTSEAAGAAGGIIVEW